MYYALGILYACYNGLIRKIDTQDDPLQPLAWVLLWPIGVLGRIATGTQHLYNKCRES